MVPEACDPATNFPTDSYLIGTRLDARRAIFSQSADALVSRDKADEPPGYKIPEKIVPVENLFAAYLGTQDLQQNTTPDTKPRIDRDTLLDSINRCRQPARPSAAREKSSAA